MLRGGLRSDAGGGVRPNRFHNEIHMPALPSRLVVTSAAAAERGLPAVGFSADLEGAALWGGPFPDARPSTRHDASNLVGGGAATRLFVPSMRGKSGLEEGE